MERKMPICPQCGQENSVNDAPCAKCQSKDAHVEVVSHMPVTQDGQQVKSEPLEAEIVYENEERYHGDREYQQGQHGQSGQQSGNAYWHVHGRGWQQHGAFRQAGNELSCLPACITLMLGISLGFQAGFLAALGFFFFYILGSALALAVSVRRTLMGKPVLLWFNRILVWLFAYAVTFSLAS